MRPRTLLVLFLVVAGLGAFIWLYERDLPSTVEMREQSRKLIVLDVDTVDELALTAGGRVVRLRRQAVDASSGSEWSLVEPARGRADASAVEELIEQIGGLEKERTLEDGSRSELGLVTPRAEIRIGGETDEVTLKLGSKIPASDNTVAEVGTGPPFYVVRDALFEHVARAPDDWRSRDAIPVARDSIRRIDILIPDRKVSLERSGDDARDFRVVSPIEDEADETRLSELLGSLTGLEIDEFLDEPGRAPELETPAASVRLTIDGRTEPMLVSIAAAGDDSPDPSAKVAVRVDGQTFRAKTDLAAQLAPAVDAWQSQRWSSRRAFEVTGLRVARGGEELVSLERSEGKWLRAGTEVDYSTVDAFLRAVTGATGAPVGTSAAEVGQAPADDLEIVLAATAGDETLRLIGSGVGRLAARSGRDVLLRIVDDSVEDILGKLEELRAVPASAAATG